MQYLQLLQIQGTELNTLEVLVYSKTANVLITEDQDNTKVASDVLVKINAELTSITSLNRIIVRVCSGSPTFSMRDFLEGLGWVVLTGDR